jgi:hypothetical protein
LIPEELIHALDRLARVEGERGPMLAEARRLEAARARAVRRAERAVEERERANKALAAFMGGAGQAAADQIHDARSAIAECLRNRGFAGALIDDVLVLNVEAEDTAADVLVIPCRKILNFPERLRDSGRSGLE